MPELPEVEVIRLHLQRLLKGKRIGGVKVFFPGSVAYPDIESFSAAIKGKIIESIGRRGKFLLFYLSGALRLVIHLRMTGSIIYRTDTKDEYYEKHCRLIILLDDGGGALYYSDIRKFGRLWLLEEQDDSIAGLQKLGPDWWTEANLKIFRSRLAKYEKSPLKRVLLEQGFIAGLGNIYVDESLFRSGIHPARQVASLSGAEQETLYEAIKEVLKDGIENGGTTIRDYRNAGGAPGGYQERIQVYGRKGASCFKCGNSIEKIVFCGRGTYFCACCQKI